jgi:hypothetical protein
MGFAGVESMAVARMEGRREGMLLWEELFPISEKDVLAV